MKITIAERGDIEYEDAGHGEVVVLLHAFPLSHEMWRPQIDALRSQYRVIAPNFSGFSGSSAHADAVTIAKMADDIRSLLDALKIHEPVTLCGLSMGGYVALAFARYFPDRLKSLILADTRAEADTDEAKQKRNDNITFAQSHTSREFIERMLPNLVNDTTRNSRPQVIQQLTEDGAAQSEEAIVAALKALRDRPDATSGLSAITVPTLVIIGADDVVIPLAAAKKLAREIPNAQLQIISDAGHISNLEQPEMFNEVVLKFLKAL